jgi:glycosyltransferase involved in cell wall biosynthesis
VIIFIDKTMNNKSSPLISIVLSVFNGAKNLHQCIDSNAHQSYPNKELIINDGGSNDGTVDLLRLIISRSNVGLLNRI